jgi:hypothetical protein
MILVVGSTRIIQNKTKQNKTKQNKTKQNKTKQNKTKQNKTKQNKTKIYYLMKDENFHEFLSLPPSLPFTFSLSTF